MYWYNPKNRVAESVPAPSTDEQANYMLEGGTDSWAFVAEYERLQRFAMILTHANC
jgi:hypothetical protein